MTKPFLTSTLLETLHEMHEVASGLIRHCDSEERRKFDNELHEVMARWEPIIRERENWDRDDD